MTNTSSEIQDNPTQFYARVPSDTNLYLVDIGKENFNYGEQILIKTEFGKDLAYITSFLFKDNENKKAYKSGTILRYPTKQDKEEETKQADLTKSFKSTISKKVLDLNLKMNITHILVPLYGKTIVVYYVAKGRVDFRELLKDLRDEFKQRIVLRQISSQEREKLFPHDCRIL